jgi:isopenicillin N synthase-like dioxygenase
MDAAPVLNLMEFAGRDAAGRRATGREVDRICRDTGFLTLAGHGVPDRVIADLRSAARQFFDLPAAQKRGLAPAPGAPYGYLGPGAEALAKSRGEETPPDLKESFIGGPALVPPGLSVAKALAFCF